MENLGNYKNRIKEIESLVLKMEGGTLSINELSTLETLTRELYERSVILKYKAFENKVISTISTGSITSINEVEENVSVTSTNSITDVSTEPINEIEESEPTIDFSIFDTPDEPEEIVVETVHHYEEEIKEEPVEIDIPEVIQEVVRETVVVETPIAELATSAQGKSFWEQLNINSNSLSTHFEGTKIDTLVGAFGLNEKLRFINDLFDGSSESFSEAIKILDNQSNLDAAKVKSSELAAKHNWDADEEAVVDFLMMVNRRYA